MKAVAPSATFETVPKSAFRRMGLSIGIYAFLLLALHLAGLLSNVVYVVGAWLLTNALLWVLPRAVTGPTGIFDVAVDGKVIFSKFATGRFPNRGEISALLK